MSGRFVILATLVVLGGVVTARTQGTGEPLGPPSEQPSAHALHQPQIAELQQMMRRIEELDRRTQQLSQALMHQKAELRSPDRDEAGLLLEFCDSVQAQTRDTRRSIDRIYAMLESPAMAHDRAMLGDVDELRDRLHVVTWGLENMAKIMEQMNERLESRTPPTGQ